ncbi:MAG: glycoside hydrolase family 2, partial [Myxococcales bacterium]
MADPTFYATFKNVKPTLSSPSSSVAAATAHPRPQLVRAKWASLDGDWSFSAGDGAERTIRVPFAPETPASGLSLGGYIPSCTYRRSFVAPKLAPGERLLLHFEAVDYVARVWVNNVYLGTHEGGYTRFSFDATDALKPSGEQSIRVEVEDDPHDLAKPRGKQDWLPEAHAIWYPRTTGIWQSVWTEVVPA